MVLPDLHDQGVQFIGMLRGFLRRLAGNGKIAEPLHLGVAGIRVHQFMACSNAPKVFIHHKNRMAQGVQKNGIGRFWPNPGKREQLTPQNVCGLARHLLQRAPMVFIQKMNKSTNAARFPYDEAGRSNQFPQVFFGN